jgi:hypothetical protein
MIPDIYEKLAHERRQTLLREAEQERKLAQAQHAPRFHWSHRLAARLGGYLIAAGTRLQRAQVIEEHSKPGSCTSAGCEHNAFGSL